MLPARSKRYAGIDGEIPRLRLVAGWQLVLIAIIMVGLLAVIFPRKALLEKLLTQEQLDALTLSYVQSLQRSDPGNLDLALLLARVQHLTLSLSAMEQLLDPVTAHGDARQRDEALHLQVSAYQRALDANPGPSQYERIRKPLAALLTSIKPGDVAPRFAGQLSSVAFRIAMPEAGLAYLDRANTGRPAEILVMQARNALGLGRYVLAAQYYFLARHQVTDRDHARDLLRAGIDCLMQANLYRQAMAAAEREVGDLGDDPQTLRYLARTALAAGSPARAVIYARRLVFVSVGGLTGEAR
jgi:hypothetical protein